MIHDHGPVDQGPRTCPSICGHEGGGLPAEAEARKSLSQFVEGERGDGHPDNRTVGVADDGVRPKFRVAGSKLDLLKYQPQDLGEAGGDFVPQLMSVGIDHDVECLESAWGSHGRTLPGSMESVDRADRPDHQ